MRVLTIVFVAMIVLLQYPLWLGKGGWLRVWEIDRQVRAQKEGNARLRVRNDALDAEVRDLKQGYDAIEERARYELGMTHLEIWQRTGESRSRESAEIILSQIGASALLGQRPPG